MPGSRSVCFVCGSVGAELRLHSKPRDNGPYFPFLDHHEPPKASRLPGPDGVVDSCRVCYAFLTQQWETYERSKTPAIKRLYWLKRTDELAFTGAEMKLQGEYMAQVMGLQYQPNCHDNCSNAPVSPDDHRVGSSGYNTAGSARDSGGFPSHDGGGGGISSGRPRPRHHTVPDPQAVVHMRTVEPEGALDLTVPSKSSEDHSVAVPSSARRQSATGFRDLIICYTCSCEMYVMNSKVVSSVRVSTSEPYFPFLEKMTPAKGAVPLSRQGLTRVCEGCFSTLCQQWIAYERACTPGSARIYKIKDKYFDISQSQPLHPSSAAEPAPEVNKARVRPEEVCYLCGQVRPQSQICPLYTVPPADKKAHMYFPFIRELRRPHGAQPLNPDGTVLVCTTCNGNLQAQWQHYEGESVPLMHRRYSLLPISSTPTSLRMTDVKVSIPRTESPRIGGTGGVSLKRRSGDGRNDSIDIHQPLNIQISKSPVLSSSSSAHGLLAIAPQTPRNISGDVSTSGSLTAMVMSEMAASGLNSKSSDLPHGASSISTVSVPHPLQQAAALPKKVCFLCGENCLLSNLHLLYSYPVRHEAKSASNSQSVPFFPFLANREPASGSDPMTDEGTVISCNYCFNSLVSQWKDFEESKNPSDSNRWLRKYSVRDFVCYVCSLMVSRRKIRTLEVYKFHFLKEHKAPPNALVLGSGEAVAACDSCYFSLTHQFAEYERMGVPMELRKYNWTTAPISEENSQEEISDQSGHGGEERWRRPHYTNEDSGHSVTEHSMEVDDSAAGLGQVTKPPALSMLSPATSGKLTPKTATVPPLSQASPSNGLTSGGSSSAALSATRTSSFAAALRKLAHQAKDPQEEAAVLAAAAKHNGSPINSSSPRSATPKRAPPPLVYSGHNASLSSPPVVTIAPTQTLSLSNDGRQSNDRVPSAHSTASSYEHYSMKHDRDQRPHSSHSRDDDRASVKESVSLPQTPTRLVPPQPSTATSREDSITRGFHPYRPEDDLRAAAAAAAALNPAFALDPAYAYHPAFLQPHPYTHPALRFEDPLLLERYRMMQAASFLPFPPPGLVPHPGVHPLLSGARYPAELLHQYQYMSPGAQGLDHRSPQVSSADRSKSEDERIRELEREREKEKREKEREREREREREAESAKREKQREVEREREKHHSDHGERRNILTVPSRYLNDRERDHHAEGRSHHHHSEASHSGKGGSISHGTPRDSEIVRSSEGSHSKNHISSNSSHNHYHHKYDNHLLTKQHDRAPSESSHSSYHHRRDSLGDVEQSKGQPPPPLVSPHRSSSKGSGESAIFRPFEKEGPSNSASAAYNDRTADMLSVPPLHMAGGGGDKSNSGSTTKPGKDSNGLYMQPSVRVFGSTHEDKLMNSNYINHRVERFDFKSLAKEWAGDSAKPVLGADLSQNAADLSQNLSLQLPPLAPLPGAQSPVVSRLDLKERRLREARASAGYNSDSQYEGDSDEEEDRKRERLTVVDSALPMELEVTPGKLGLLDALGLATLQKKKDLQCRLFRKRRRSMREPSISPVEMEDGESCDIHPEKCTLPSPTIHPASLCLEPDYQEKCKFMLGFGIMPLTSERRAELEAVRLACEDCKRRQLEKRKKRAQRGQSSESQPEDGVVVAVGMAPGSNKKRKCDQLDQSQNVLDHTIEPLRITLGQLQERHLAAARQQQQKNHVHAKFGADGSRSAIFPDSQGRQLGREFAEQFHESVLQSTRQKEMSQKSGHSSDGRLHLPSSTSVQPGDGSRPVFRWPGIEGVLESYIRHREEERMEAQVLLDRCRQLHTEKSELHKVAESLNQRMRVLHQELSVRDAERQQTQSAIDNLKKCLHIYR